MLLSPDSEDGAALLKFPKAKILKQLAGFVVDTRGPQRMNSDTAPRPFNLAPPSDTAISTTHKSLDNTTRRGKDAPKISIMSSISQFLDYCLELPTREGAGLDNNCAAVQTFIFFSASACISEQYRKGKRKNT